MQTVDTIAAISTPFGEGAVALVRISGPRALEIADAVFRCSRGVVEIPDRYQQFGRLMDGDAVLDEVMLTRFREPASYTGEDVVEISCHGGILVTRRALDIVLEKGARIAEPGEFTQRAFLNGKMDLTQAEAVMDLITAQTSLALRAATEQLEGRLGQRVREIREILLDLLAHVEAYIDFPEEDIDPRTGRALLDGLERARDAIDRLLDTADQGRVLREGVRTVIYGAPNVGKSSLLNVLLGYDRAIVSETPGTTRDTIEEVINLQGIPLRLVDTAGMRDSSDAIEREGIARTVKHRESADLVLHVEDGSLPKSHGIWTEAGPREILILNKRDLGLDESWASTEAVAVSCRTSDGLDRLGEAVFERIMGGRVLAGNAVVAINARHKACLKSARHYCEEAARGLGENLPPELVAVEVRGALDSVGEVVGKADVEELLGRIFSTFCIGK